MGTMDRCHGWTPWDRCHGWLTTCKASKEASVNILIFLELGLWGLNLEGWEGAHEREPPPPHPHTGPKCVTLGTRVRKRRKLGTID
jgi:hypothetical protein